jgi:uncharacterized repeat protein (TIGR01451 family)
MNKGNYIWRWLYVLVVLAVVIPATVLGPVPMAQAVTVSYAPTGGSDATTGTAIAFTGPVGTPGTDLYYLATSDNNRMATNTTWPTGGAYNEGRYLEFLFTPSVPAGATVSSAIITFEYQRSGTLNAQKLEVWQQSTTSWVNVAIGSPGSSNTDQTFTVDVSSIIATQGDANSFKFRFLANTSYTGRTTSHDFVSVQFEYNRTPNAPTGLLTNGATNPTNVATLNTFSWTFSDPDSGDGQSAYQIQLSTDSGFGTTVWDSGKVNSTSSTNVPYGGSTLAQDGLTYYWRVRTWDNSGVSNNGPSAWSANAQFTMINNQPPNQPVNSTPATGSYVNNANPAFTWSAFSDPDAGNTQQARQVQLRTNGGTYGGAGSQDSGTQAGATNTWTPTTWNLTDGTTYCWHVRVEDNYSTWSSYSTETCFTEDRTAAASNATSPAYANAAFSVTATNVSDGGSGVANVRLYFRGPTGSWTQVPGTIAAPGPYGWSFTPALGDGTYYFQSVACDALNNCETIPSGTGGTGDSATIYDATPPTSQATPPSGPLNFGNIAVPWTADGAVSGIAANGVTLYYNYAGGAYSAYGAASGTSGTFTFTPSSGDGTYCFYTRAADNAGNVEAAPATNDGCTIYRTWATVGDRVWLDTNGNGVQDAGETGINGVTLSLLHDGNVVGTATTAGDGNYLFANLQGWLMRTVRDNFTTAAYTNNDGTADWATSWVETDSGGGGATGGNVLVTGGALAIDTGGSSIYRQADLTGSSSASLSFSFRTSGSSVDSSDAINLEISGDGGNSWTTLEQFLGNYGPSYSGSRTYDISAYIGTGTRLRFTVPSGSYSSSNETFYIDNVQIAFDNMSSAGYTVSVDASNFNAGGALVGYQPTDGPSAMSPLAVTLAAGEDFNTADFGYGPFAVIGGLVYQDSDRSGTLDSGEPGLPNITVWLYSDGNDNGVIDGSDAILKTTTTGAGGVYYFGGIETGSYTVLADVNDPDLPGGFRPTSPNPAPLTGLQSGSAHLATHIGFNTPPPLVKDLYLRATSPLSYLTRLMPTLPDRKSVQILSSDSYPHDHSVTWTMPVTQALAAPLTFASGQAVQAVLRIDARASTSALACGGQLPDVTLTLGVVGGPTLAIAFVNDMPAGENTRYITLNIPAGTTLAAGSRLQLKVDASGADCSLNYPSLRDEDADGYIIVFFDAPTDLSRLELPVVSYIRMDQGGTYDAAYPAGATTPVFIQGATVYVRATASDPFGAFDISGSNLTVPGVVTNTAMTQVASGSLTRTYQTALPGLLAGSYSYVITATEGSEGVVTAVATGTFQVVASNMGNSSKTVDKASAAPGDVLTYTITLSNTGGLAASVRMTDTLPPNVTYADTLRGPASATYNSALDAVVYNGSIAANAQVTITYRVTTSLPLDDGTVIANNATINDSYSRFDTSPPATTIIHSSPSLSTSTKTVDRATAAPGDSLVYTIILTNTGNMNAYIGSGLPLVDDIPANSAYDGGLSATAGTISFNPGFNRIEWYGTVLAHSSVTLRYRVKLAWPLDNGTAIVNTAVINEGSGFSNPQTYQRTVTTTIVSAPNLTAQSAKLVDKTLAAPGDALVYTILLKNSGNMNAPGVTLTDTLPAEVTWGGDAFMSSTSGVLTYTAATRTMSWTGDVNAGQTVQILFRAVANSPLPNNTQIVNVAGVADATGNFTPFNLQAITTIQAAPNLNTSTKTVNTATASPGAVLTYTIRLVNSGNAVASTSVADTLPAQLQNPFIISVSGGQAQIVGGTVITWTGQVTPSQPVTITFRATLLPVLDNGTQVANTALVNDGVNPAFYIAPPAVTTIQSSPNLNTSLKTVDKATAAPGDFLIYTIALTNSGNMATNALMRDDLPPNVTFNGGLSASPSAPLPTYSSISNRVTWQGPVVPGQPITVSYRVQVNTPLNNGTVIQNDAEVNDGIHLPYTTQPPALTTITSAPDLTTSSKSVDLSTASPGQLLHYTIRLVNTGNMVAAGVVLTDIIPAEVTYASGPSITGGGSGGWDPGQRRIYWTGPVAPGSDVIVEYYVTVNNPLPSGTVIVNDAAISSSVGSFTTNQVTTVVQSDHLLGINKSAPSAVGAGQRITYTLQYNVTGNEPAPGVVITDAVPANTTYVSCTGGCTQPGGIPTWNLGNLVPGNSGTVLMVVQVQTPLPDGTLIANTAYISDTENAPLSASASTTVTSGHGFSLSKSDAGYDPVQAGGTLVYTLTWSVGGTAQATGVVITDALPANTNYVSCGGATCSHAGGVVTWNLSNQNPGANGNVTVVVTVTTPLPNGTLLTNNARIYDTNGGLPTTASEQTTVQSSHSLGIDKTGPTSVQAGGQITYTINWSVTGNEASQNLVIEDNTPVNTTFASASGAGTIESPGSGVAGLVRWRLGTQNPGASGTVTLVVNVNSPLPNGTVINNSASIYDSNGGATRTSSFTTTVNSSHSFTLAKSDTPDPAAPNGLINYTIHWTVTGNAAAVGMVITDAIPLNTSYATCGACVLMGNYVSWAIGDRNPGASGDVFLQVRADTPLVNGTQINNLARISDNNGGVPVTASSVTTINSDHQLALTKSAPSVVAAGQPLTYTLQYNVTGNAPAPTVVITDVVPANTTFVSCTGGCTQAGSLLTWNLGDLVPGNSGTLSFIVTVSDLLPNGTVINNMARMYDAASRAAVGTASTTVSSGHGFSLSKRDTGYDPVQAGGVVVYSIDWSLAGTEAATSVVITDAVPANTSYVNCGGATCSQTDGIVTWNLNNQNPGTGGTVVMTVTVAGALPNGTVLTNQARIHDSNGGLPTTATEQTTVESSHALHITKVGPATVAAGGQITYTLRYTATGNETALNVLVDDTTPPNTTFARASGAATIDTPGIGNTGLVRWHLGNLAPNASGVVTLTVNVNSPLPSGTVINNQASVSDSNGGATDSGQASTTVTSGHAFTLSKTDTPDPTTPNGVINYTIQWSVTGNEAAQAVVITDAIPANTSYSTCGACVLMGDYVRWDLGTQNPGASNIVFLQVRVDSAIVSGTVIANYARIADGNNGTAAVATATTTVNSGHQFTLSKTAPSTIQAGQELDYVINWSATGNEPASNVVVTDTVPANTTFASCSDGCANPGVGNSGVITWTLGNLTPGDSGALNLAVMVTSPLSNGTRITNTARIFDASRSAQATAQTTVSSAHSYSLGKYGSPDPVEAGGVLTYTLAWSLSGSEVATGVVITDALPANTSYVGCSGGVSCTRSGGIITWTLGTQAINASGTVTLVVSAANPLPNGTLLTNNARISDGNGGVPATVSAQTTVHSGHGLAIAKSGPTTVAAGGQITYTLRYTVTGNETALGVTIDDNTPVNTTFASATGAGTIQAPPVGSTGLVRWQLGSLTPGTVATATLVVNVVSPLPNGTVIANTASIADSNGGTTANSSWNTTVGSGHSFTLSKADTPDPVAPNGIIYYTIYWTLSGNETAQNVVITDAIPANTTLVSPGTCAVAGTTVQCLLGTQAPGANGAVSLQVRANTPLTNGTVITNVARISDSNGGAPLVATTTTTVSSDHQFTLNKSAASVVQAGQYLTYTLSWSVTGDEPATGVTITDAVPANTSYVTGSCTGGCTVAGGVVSWALGAQVPGNNGVVQFTVLVTSPLPNGTVIANTGRIFDASRSAQSSTSTTVGSGHGYSLTKSDVPDPVAAGGALVYTLNWSLSGNEAATGVVITDALPANTSYVGCSGGVSCVRSGGVITWTLGSQGVGASGTVMLTATVANPLPNGTLLTNNARISDGNGGVPSTASAQTTVSSSHALGIAKSGPTTVAAGGQITYTLRYTVTGNETALGVTIDDNTPVNTTFASAAGAGTIQAPPVGSSGVVRWQLGNLPPGTAAVATLVVNVVSPLPNGTVIANTASIADSNGGTTANSSWNTSVGSNHSLTLTKGDSPDPVSAGSYLNYTLHWTVSGSESAQSVVITDTIPTNTTFFGCSGCSQQGSIVVWNLGTRQPGESGDVTLQVQVNSPLANGISISNQARIADSNGGTPATASTSTTVQSNHQLTLSKSAPSVASAGQSINYTLNWSVTGNEPAPGVVLTDAVPANTTYVSCTGGCNPPVGGIVTWNLGNHNPGDSGTVTMQVAVGGVVPNGTIITNNARISDGDGASALASASTTVSSGHGFSLSKRDSVDPVQAGSQLTYSLDWAVSGTEAGQNVTINDTLPANTSFVGCAPAQCSLSGGVVTWNLGTQNPNASGTATLIVIVASPLANGTLLSNQARISDSNGGVATSSNIEQTTVNSSHTLQVRKSAPATVGAGGQIAYTILYTVTGNEAAQNVIIEDNTPSNTTFASASGAATIDNPGVGGTGAVSWHLPSPLNPGATGTVVLTVNVANPLPNGTVINNTASIRDSNNGATGQSSASTTVNSGHSLALTKQNTPDPVSAGGYINYTLHWTVSGSEGAQSVVITDTIPANTTFFGCSGCSQQGGTVRWSLGTLNPGESGDVTLQVQVNSPLANGITISNQARISDSNGGTPVTASTSTTVQSNHQLTLSKSAPSVASAGQTINYTLNWSVTGNEPAPGVVITDAVPANTTYVSCTGGCNPPVGGIVTWNLGNHNPGDSGTLSMVVTVGSVVPNGTVITNNARIYDTDGASAQASAQTTVSSGHGFSLSKRDSVDPVQAGSQLVYSLDWAVSGTEAGQNVTINDTLPANTSFMSCAPTPCSLSGGVVTWNLGTQNPNASGTATLTATVTSPLLNGTLLSNQARISDSNGGLPASSNIEQTTVNSSHTLQVSKRAPATTVPGAQIIYTIVYTVSGNGPAQNAIIEDNTPSNTTFASASGAAAIDNPGVGGTGLVRWYLGNRNPVTTGVVTLTVNVANPLPGGTVINNIVRIYDGNGGATDQYTIGTIVNSGHTLALSKSDTPDPVSPNNLINYTLHWSVDGNEAAQNVVISDTLPANTTFVFCGCSQQGNVLQWNLGSHNPGESGDVTLQVRVNPLTPNGTIIANSAHINDGNGGTPATATTTTTVRSSHSLTIDKRAPATVAVGQPIIYTIDYSVVGDEVAPGVAITDAIPAGTTYVAGSCTSGCTVAGDVITWDLADVTPGSQGQVQFAVRVNNDVPNGTDVVNTAYIFDNSGQKAVDSTTTRVGTGLTIILTDNRDTVQPGEFITYTMTFSGTDPLLPGLVEIDYPANTTLVGESTGYLIGGANTIQWLVAQQAGVAGQRYLVVQLPPVMDNGTVISAVARISANGQANQDDESAVVVSQPDLSTSGKTVSNPGARAGDLVTYHIVLTNTGNMQARQVIITDTLPASMTLVSGPTASSGAVTFTDGDVRWNGQVLVGAPVDITFNARVAQDAVEGATIENYVGINDGFHPDELGFSATITVGSGAPPTIGKTYLPLIVGRSGNIPPSGNYDVELTIRNCGSANAVGAFWVDLYFNPNEQSPYWPISHGEGYDWFGQGAGFTISTLGPGQSYTLHLSDAIVKNMPTNLTGTPRVYAQVDWVDETTPGMGVVWEGTPGEQNNVADANGAQCAATAGLPDLIVENINIVSLGQQVAPAAASPAVKGGSPAPVRPKPPKR